MEAQAPALLAAVLARDVDRVRRLLADGANPRRGDGRQLPLHAHGPDRDAIVTLLDQTSIADPVFRDAVVAIHAGDVATLARLLAAHPDLLQRRNVGPEAFRWAKRHDYFRDPKLFLVRREQPDADRAAPGEHRRRRARDGRARRRAERSRLCAGTPHVGASPTWREMTASRTRPAPRSGPRSPATPAATRHRRGRPRSVGQPARIALDAGADVNGMLPVHSHRTARHQAAADDDGEMVALLVGRGARIDIRDTLWDATPLDWAVHDDNAVAREALEKAAARRIASL